MKKLISGILSAVFCAAAACAALTSASAETVFIDPELPLHGNICGQINILSYLPKSADIKITQVTPEGEYDYYTYTIPECEEGSEPNTYSFEVEGKLNSSYIMSVSIEQHEELDEPLTFTKTFSISDTDFVTDKTVNKYICEYSFFRDDSLTEPYFSTEISRFYTDENNNQYQFYSISVPVEGIVMGDVNGDKIVNIFDTALVAKYTVGAENLDKRGVIAADYDKNGIVNIFDAVEIAKLTVM